MPKRLTFIPCEGSAATNWDEEHLFPPTNNQNLIFGLTAFQFRHSSMHISPSEAEILTCYRYIFTYRFNMNPKSRHVDQLLAQLGLQDFNAIVDKKLRERVASLLKNLQSRLKNKGLIFANTENNINVVPYPKNLLEHCLAPAWDGTFDVLPAYLTNGNGTPSNYAAALASSDFTKCNSDQAIQAVVSNNVSAAPSAPSNSTASAAGTSTMINLQDGSEAGATVTSPSLGGTEASDDSSEATNSSSEASNTDGDVTDSSSDASNDASDVTDSPSEASDASDDTRTNDRQAQITAQQTAITALLAQYTEQQNQINQLTAMVQRLNKALLLMAIMVLITAAFVVVCMVPGVGQKSI